MRTPLRAKLPQTLSHPIGLAVIESALAGAPQRNRISVTFGGVSWRATQFQRSLRDRNPYVLLTASFEPARKPGFTGSKRMAEHGFYDEAWEVEVSPTLRELRSLARRLLISEGLPRIASWLRRVHAESGDSRYRRIELVFDPDRESIEAREHVGA